MQKGTAYTDADRCDFRDIDGENAVPNFDMIYKINKY